jgi:putative NIF3 family GTP cyclohydrolase 1 type 2
MADTEKIMETALELADLSEVPEDSGIWVPGRSIQRILFGIDIGTAELEIAQRLGYDLVIAHHPPEATLEAWQVFLRHVDQMVAAGTPRNVAEEAVANEIEMMQLRAQGRNYEHTVSVARLLGMPYMNIHLPLDEIGRQRMQAQIRELLDENPQASVGDVAGVLEQFGEVKNAATRLRIACGDLDTPAGKVVVSHGALDMPTYPILTAYFSHGVDTVVCLRVQYADLVHLRQDKVGSLIVVGHNAGDSLGINPFLTALEAMGLEITRISGVIPG